MPRETPCPSPPLDADPTDWGAFESKEGFELAELVYCKARMSGESIDKLLKIDFGGQVPFSNHRELYAAIDSLAGGVPWQSVSIKYNGVPSDNSDAPRPKWMLNAYEVFYRDPRLVVHEMLANPDFKDDIDFAPYRIFNEDGDRVYQHLMSGDWAWEQAVSFLTSPNCRLDVLAHRDIALNVGCDSSGPKNARGNACPYHSRK
jgi:hypothetical protein